MGHLVVGCRSVSIVHYCSCVSSDVIVLRVLLEEVILVVMGFFEFNFYLVFLVLSRFARGLNMVLLSAVGLMCRTLTFLISCRLRLPPGVSGRGLTELVILVLTGVAISL